MNLQKLNPWNWFKHEDQDKEIVPIKRDQYGELQHPISSLHQEIDRLFDQAFKRFPFPSLTNSPLWKQSRDHVIPSFHANLNVASDDKAYTISLEAPGLEQEDLDIELKDRVLVIRGNKQQEKEDKNKHYYRIERHYGSFERVLAVPNDANVDEITANMDKGVLTINIPRTEVAESGVKKISINKA